MPAMPAETIPIGVTIFRIIRAIMGRRSSRAEEWDATHVTADLTITRRIVGHAVAGGILDAPSATGLDGLGRRHNQVAATIKLRHYQAPSVGRK
jgi:hypothetical protein